MLKGRERKNKVYLGLSSTFGSTKSQTHIEGSLYYLLDVVHVKKNLEKHNPPNCRQICTFKI